MTTENNTKDDSSSTSQLSSVAELAAGFAAKSEASQQEGQQQNQQDVSGGTATSGSSSGGTTPSSTATTPSKDEMIAGLTLDELLAHPTLGPQLQSHADKVAATKLTGVSDKVRRETIVEMNRARFDAMDQGDIAELLSSDKEAAKAYAEVQATPPPPTQEQLDSSQVGQAVSFFTTGIRTTSAMIARSELPDAVKASLAPEKHLVAADHPGMSAEEIYAAWQLKVNDAVTEHRIKSATASLSESTDLNNQALADEQAGKGALMTNGTSTSPLPDFMSTSGRNLLADGFARRAASTRS